MAETERPHRSTSINSSNNNITTTASTTSDLFICFTSRLSSSSSMRLSSKSILSPARSASLTTSLSRRLRTSGSLKSASASGGGNGGVLKSPMFGNNGGRKRSGSGYDNNPEPSSPKVTCIGQVRVKTRKHVKNKMRARSRRKGESSFRRSADQSDGGGCRFDASENRWVHLPVTICESLRAFGSELNCFLPCRSSCADGSNHRDGDGRPLENDGCCGGSSCGCGGCCDGGRCCGDGSCCVGRSCCGDGSCCRGGSCCCVGKCCSGGSCCGSGKCCGGRCGLGNCCTGGSCGRGGSCCGAVFTRWFVAVEETGGKRREIELVVGGGDEAEQEERRRSRRRHVFEGLDFSELDAMKTEKKEREEAGRISICVPPKNALLLMRCRSDPVKVEALASRVRESQKSQNNDPEEVKDKVVEVEEENERIRFEQEMEDKKRIEICEKWISGEPIVEREIAEVEPPQASLREEEERRAIEEEEEQEEEEMKVLEDSVVEAAEESKVLEDSCEEEMEATFMRKIEDDIKNVLKEEEHTAEMGDSAAAAAAETAEKEERVEEENEGIVSVTVKGSEDPDDPDNPDNPEPDPSPEPEKRGSQAEETAEKEKAPYKVLPDCLLLMMCEPKLSMEVSRETWVCSTDFVRWLPERPPAKKPVAGDQPKKRTDSNASSRRRSTDKPMIANQVLLQPPRSSCSYPAAPPAIVAAGAMAAEQKAGGANKAAYEPGMLQRCKSEPRRSAAKLAPEACFWKNRKLEPHPPATLGVGAAGVGF